jgi:choline-sulfatase
MFGTYLADHAAAFLARPRTRPFFLYVSFHETHSPFNFPAGWPRRDPGEFAAPPVSPAEWAECPEVFRELADADRRGVIAAYHTSAHFLDRNVGRVLDALDRGGRAGDTLVLFTSDHGYFVGQRGRFEKHACLDPAVRTAVLARWPGVIPAGRASAALASLVDLAPTVLVACGLPVPLELHGRSLLPLWQGEADTHRNRVYLDYADNAEAGVRTDRWKLVYCAGTRLWRDGYAAPGDPRPWVRLYDLAADPGEVVNLAGLPAVAGVGEELLTDLADHVRRTDRRPVPAGDDPLAVLGALLGPPDADPLAEFLRRRGGD